MVFLPLDGTLLLLVPAIILSIYAQFAIRNAYAKWSKIRSSVGMTGAQVAQKLLQQNGLYDVEVEQVAGTLSDHYDSRAKKVRLSSEIYNSTSLAALGVAAHETGHAIQHANNYAPLNLRQSLFPVASIGSTWGFWIFLIGMFISSFSFLMDVGILLFAGAAAFQIVTLPVEFNASNRALAQLSNGGYLRADEINGAKKSTKCSGTHIRSSSGNVRADFDSSANFAWQ